MQQAIALICVAESYTTSFIHCSSLLPTSQVTLEGKWVAWSTRVPQIEIETHRVAATDLVVPTIDTVRHEHLLYSWLAEHKPIVLCGPPGSGKTMTLFSALRGLPDMEVCRFQLYLSL